MPWENMETFECWKAFVEYQNMKDSDVRRIYENPPVWSGIETAWIIFHAGFTAGRK